MTHGTSMKMPRIADYRQRVPIEGKLRDLRCMRGPIEATAALRDLTVASNPGAIVRYETINHGLDERYVEIVMPTEG